MAHIRNAQLRIISLSVLPHSYEIIVSTIKLIYMVSKSKLQKK